MQIPLLVGCSSPSVLTVSHIRLSKMLASIQVSSFAANLYQKQKEATVFMRARDSIQSKLNRLQAAKRLLMCLGKRSKQSFCVYCFHCSLFRALFSLS